MNRLINFVPLLILVSFILIFIVDVINVENIPTVFHFKLKFLIFMHITAFFVSLYFLKYFKIPFLLLISFFSIINYGVVFCEIPHNMYQLGELNYEIIDLLCFAFFTFYITAIFCNFLLSRSDSTFNSTLKNVEENKSILKYFILLLYLIDLSFGINIAGINELLENFVLGVFFYFYLKGKNSFLENAITFILFAFVLIKGLFSGFGYAIIYSLVFAFGVFLSNRNFKSRSILLMLTVSIAAFFFINIISRNKEMLRSYDELSNYSVKDKLALILTTDKTVQNDVPITSTSIWRASYQVSALSLVSAETPARVPFWYGRSYEVILYKFIPRFLWLNKPREEMGQLFGHTYNITRQTDNNTSMNAPLIAESYMNFSNLGVFCFCLLYGVLVSMISLSINRVNSCNDVNDYNCLDILVISQISLYLIQMESNFSLMVGKLVILFVLRFVFRKVIQLAAKLY